MLIKDGLLRTKINKKRAYNVYQLIVLYALGALAGFVVEVVWCALIFKRLEWRSGMLFTPFNPVYGLGAVTLLMGLSKIDKDRVVTIFLTGAIVGTLVELFCSYFQEYFFHSFSWDYRHLPFNFEGRICLYMALAWGGLSVVFARFVVPALDKLFAYIPDKILKPLAITLATVIALDAFLTVMATARFIARTRGVVQRSFLGDLLDKFFPDKRMRFTFPRISIYR